MLLRILQYILITCAAGLAIYAYTATDPVFPVTVALVLLGAGFLLRAFRLRHHLRRSGEPDMIPYTFLKRYKDPEKADHSKETEEELRRKYSAKGRKN
ncbi:hypothetical protein CR205_03735 [Alteribacter lacisalsi]|uniref:Uncharacterized protein n=1 Tax=Alteribacter lacisalsi TaxID=2045244 RepID=A0A2W0HA94_9BACI|nr:hypothetical protein [Alteribacter lacisalsi]PYZ97716.1 hypothetical protein CR205_03735 [Alteribacter lacisalsi]